MNNDTRKQLAALAARIEACKSEAEAIAEELDILSGDERDKFDNMPEGLQMSDRGEAMERAADALESARDELQSFDWDSIDTYLAEASE